MAYRSWWQTRRTGQTGLMSDKVVQTKRLSFRFQGFPPDAGAPVFGSIGGVRSSVAIGAAALGSIGTVLLP